MIEKENLNGSYQCSISKHCAVMHSKRKTWFSRWRSQLQKFTLKEKQTEFVALSQLQPASTFQRELPLTKFHIREETHKKVSEKWERFELWGGHFHSWIECSTDTRRNTLPARLPVEKRPAINCIALQFCPVIHKTDIFEWVDSHKNIKSCQIAIISVGICGSSKYGDYD